MKKVLRKNSGITLVALVITIVVLLILAGVSISLTLGENGLITRAQQAKEKHEEAANNESDTFKELESQIQEIETGIEIPKVTDTNPGVLETDETDADTYIINSIEDLVFFAYDVTKGNTYEGKKVNLGLSLDFNSSKSYVNLFRTNYGEYGYDGELKTLLTNQQGFIPIGTTYDKNISTNYFNGTFDGQGNFINNLYINIENSEYVTTGGLFTTNGGSIKNIQLENINFQGTTNNSYILLGGITGRNYGTIEQCSTSGKINIIANGIRQIYTSGVVSQGFKIL